jgi:predicted metal-dependent hydrolase
MKVLKNRRMETVNLNLSKEYTGIGKTLAVQGKTKVTVPDLILKEKEVTRAIEKKLLVVQKTKEEIQTEEAAKKAAEEAAKKAAEKAAKEKDKKSNKYPGYGGNE